MMKKIAIQFFNIILIINILFHCSCHVSNSCGYINLLKKEDTEYKVYFFPYNRPESVWDNSFETSIGLVVECHNCQNRFPYKILEYQVYLIDDLNHKDKFIGRFSGEFFSPELLNKAKKLKFKYPKIELRNIIVLIEDKKIINLGTISTKTKSKYEIQYKDKMDDIWKF